MPFEVKLPPRTNAMNKKCDPMSNVRPGDQQTTDTIENTRRTRIKKTYSAPRERQARSTKYVRAHSAHGRHQTMDEPTMSDRFWHPRRGAIRMT